MDRVIIEVLLEEDIRDLVVAHLATQDTIELCRRKITAKIGTGRHPFLNAWLPTLFASFYRNRSAAKAAWLPPDLQLVPSLVIAAHSTAGNL